MGHGFNQETSPENIKGASEISLEDSSNNIKQKTFPFITIKQNYKKIPFHAHSESLLISLLASSLNEIRTFAVNIILKVRGDSEQSDASVRNRKKPTLNFDAVTLHELTNWSNEQILGPNFICNMTKKDLQKINRFSYKSTLLSSPHPVF